MLQLFNMVIIYAHVISEAKTTNCTHNSHFKLMLAYQSICPALLLRWIRPAISAKQIYVNRNLFLAATRLSQTENGQLQKLISGCCNNVIMCVNASIVATGSLFPLRSLRTGISK